MWVDSSIFGFLYLNFIRSVIRVVHLHQGGEIVKINQPKDLIWMNLLILTALLIQKTTTTTLSLGAELKFDDFEKASNIR